MSKESFPYESYKFKYRASSKVKRKAHHFARIISTTAKFLDKFWRMLQTSNSYH